SWRALRASVGSTDVTNLKCATCVGPNGRSLRRSEPSLPSTLPAERALALCAAARRPRAARRASAPPLSLPLPCALHARAPACGFALAGGLPQPPTRRLISELHRAARARPLNPTVLRRPCTYS